MNTNNKNQIHYSFLNEDIDTLACFLRQLVAFRDAVLYTAGMVEKTNESEKEIRESIALRTVGFQNESVMYTRAPDQKSFRFIEEYVCEKEIKIRNTRRLRQIVKEDIRLLHRIKDSVLTLPEPHRSLFLLRYFQKKRWKDIQVRIQKSESSVYRIHADGLRQLCNILGKEKLDILRKRLTIDYLPEFSTQIMNKRNHSDLPFAYLNHVPRPASSAPLRAEPNVGHKSFPEG